MARHVNVISVSNDSIVQSLTHLCWHSSFSFAHVQDAFVFDSVIRNEQINAEHGGLVVAYIVAFSIACIVSMVCTTCICTSGMWAFGEVCGVYCAVHWQGSVLVRMQLAHQQYISRRRDFLEEITSRTNREARLQKLLKMEKDLRKGMLLAYVALSGALFEDVPMAVLSVTLQVLCRLRLMHRCLAGVVSVSQPCAGTPLIDYGADQCQLLLVERRLQAE